MIKPNSRLRWWIADQLNRLRGQCWSDLVMWAITDDPEHARRPWSPISSSCRKDFERNGTCYCAKLCVPELRPVSSAVPGEPTEGGARDA